MIISRTPFRVSFAGGGTDFKGFYKNEFGAVTSVTINKYMYITVNKRFDDTIRLSYSKTEIVDDFKKIVHPIVREALKLTGITRGIEITSIADVPAGTGVGSSSSFTVGLLNALYAYQGKHKSAEELAREACYLEIDVVGEPIGKQDQYIAAYGGLQHIQFNPDESVYVDPVICSKETLKKLEKSLLLFYTGTTREAMSILKEQKQNIDKKQEYLKKLKELSVEARDCLIKNNLDEFGKLLHKGWNYKKELSSGITNNEINEYYEKGIRAGAYGGKLLGAGGGGFLLFFCPEEAQARVRGALNLREMPFSFEPQGTKIIYVGV